MTDVSPTDVGQQADLPSLADVSSDQPPDEEPADGGLADIAAHDAGAEDLGPFVAAVPCLQASDYVTAPRQVSTVGTTYSPACLRISAGDVVTIESSGVHPLEPRDIAPDPNPIPFQNSTTAVRFATPGFYGFQCPEHVDQGMKGVVWVTP